MSKRAKYLIGAALAGFFVVAYVASPYWAAYQMRSAAEARDGDRLATYIDFPSVRESVKSQVMASFAESMATELKENPFAGLAGAFAAKMVDGLVDTFVTPDGLATLIEKGKAEGSLAGAPPAAPRRDGGTTAGAAGEAGRARPNVSQRYKDIDTFEVAISSPEGETGPLVLRFRRSSLFQWRVTSLRIPFPATNQASATNTVAMPPTGSASPGPAPEETKSWIFRWVCAQGALQDDERVAAPDRTTAIVQMCRRDCTSKFGDGSRIQGQCLGECAAGWNRGRAAGADAGGVWGDSSCQYAVSMAPPPPEPTPEMARNAAVIETVDQRHDYWNCKEKPGAACVAEKDALLAACARQKFQLKGDDCLGSPPPPRTDPVGRAIASAREAAEKDPKDVKAWVALGNALFDGRRPKEAIDAYARALELRPDDAHVLSDQGVMYRDLGQFETAIAKFQKANQVDPKHVQGFYNIGVVYYSDLHQPKKAIEVWNTLIRTAPKSPEATQARAAIKDAKRKDR